MAKRDTFIFGDKGITNILIYVLPEEYKLQDYTGKAATDIDKAALPVGNAATVHDLDVTVDLFPMPEGWENAFFVYYDPLTKNWYDVVNDRTGKLGYFRS